MTFDPLVVYHLSKDLLTCAANKVAQTTGGVPATMRVGAAPGLVAADDCCAGLLVVSVGNTYPSTTFPLPDLASPPCGVALAAVNITVWIMRCAPTIRDDGSPPTVDQLEAGAQLQNADARAVWVGLACCLSAFRDAGFEAVMGTQQPYGPEGGCMGSQTQVTIGFSDPCDCDG